MYTSHIGKRFVEIYNRRMNCNLTAKNFFETIYFPLFFDHSKLLQSPGNTPIFQLIATKKTSDPDARKKAMTEIADKVNKYLDSESLTPDMSFAIGYGSADDFGTTSGQITSLNLSLLSEDAYSSWIGSGLGIGVGGGQNMLIDSEEILWSVYEGWALYRKWVNQTDGINNKIDTWNGIWLRHRLSLSFNEDSPEFMFNPISLTKEGGAQMIRPSWIELLSVLSFRYGGTTLSAYIYQFSQTNVTVGFIQINLPEIYRVYQIFTELFASSGIKVQNLAQQYETQIGFGRACENGIIGLRQLEPKDLKKYMPGGDKLPSTKDYEKSQITFNIYLTWIIAMLNNKEFLHLANHTASALHKYIAGDKNAKKTRSNEVEAVINSKSKKEFASTLTPLVEKAPELASEFNTTLDAVHLDIPIDNVSYFITLLRFKFSLPEQTLNS